MTPPPDNFDSLEKLLRLKRHEQPPPRYFNEFSTRVLGRIERGDMHVSWWEKLGFDLRPALAAGAGLVACGLIIYGVATTEADAGSVARPGGASLAEAAIPPLEDAAATLAANSTNPVPTYGTPIDRKAFQGQVIPVGFSGR